MRILHVTTHMNVGGIGQYILTLCSKMKKQDVDCMVASSGGNLESELKKNAVKHVRLDIKTKFEFGPKVFKAVSALSDIIRSEKIDVVHAHTRVSQVASFFASRRTGAHYISTCHGYFKPRLSRRIFDAWGERVVAISAPVMAHLERDLMIDRSRIELIHNGIDLGRFSKNYSGDEIAAIKRSIGLGEGPVIGSMGRLSSVKGHGFLIEAMMDIASKDPSAQCLLIGSGPEESALKALAADKGVACRIRFTGSLYDDVPKYLACMDLFVLPSVKEGLGLALLEAMAAGRPCIASDIGGIGDIIKDGTNGILFPVANPKSIADAALRLLNDSVLRAGLARAGRESVKKNFSISLMAEKMSKLYDGVINGNK